MRDAGQSPVSPPRVFARMREVDREAGQVREVGWSLQEVTRHLESLGRLGEEGWPLPEEAWARWGHTSHPPGSGCASRWST